MIDSISNSFNIQYKGRNKQNKVVKKAQKELDLNKCENVQVQGNKILQKLAKKTIDFVIKILDTL